MTKKEFLTAKEFRRFLEENSSAFDKLYVKEVYNLGDEQYCDSPLFLYSGYSLISLYLSKGTLSLKVYDKDYFIPRIRSGIFREEPDSDDFYYFDFTKSSLINSFAEEISIKETESESINNIELIFKNGLHLSVEESKSVSGTMFSKLTD